MNEDTSNMGQLSCKVRAGSRSSSSLSSARQEMGETKAEVQQCRSRSQATPFKPKSSTSTTRTRIFRQRISVDQPDCIYSRSNISFLLALTVSYGFIIAFPSVRSPFNLVYAASTQSVESTASTSNNDSALSNYLLYTSVADSTAKQHHHNHHQQQQNNAHNPGLDSLLRDSNHSHASAIVDLQLANEVWTKMHDQVGSYAKSRVNLLRPTINNLLSKANVSLKCSQSILDTMDHLASLDDWAVMMYNSFGNFPAGGFFEGTHTSMGSYHQCVNVEPNELIGQAQYCTLKFQPVIPQRPRYHNILATIDNLANFTRNNDIFHSIAKKAHYFYYTKLRLATCMPTKCEKIDLERLGEQIAVNTYLQYQGVQCLQKSNGFEPDGSQIFALTVLILMASVSLIGTLIHLFNIRSFFVASSSSRRYKHRHNHHLVDLKSSFQNNKNATSKAFEQAIVLQQQQKLLLSITNKPSLDHHLHIDDADDHHYPQKNHSVLSSPGLVGGNNNGTRSRTTGMQNGNEKILSIIDVLLHFSIIRNGKKLFDTSTSRRQRAPSSQLATQAGSSLMPGMREPVAVGVVISDASSSGSSQSSRGDVGGNGGGGGNCNSSTNSTAGGSSTDGAGSSACSTTGSQLDECSSTMGVNETDNHQRPQQSNDISCVHGLRFWTISWIILGHTMQYTEWAGFGRAYQVEQNITSFFLHPLLNATFSVDTFFLISGLLTTYVTWSITGGKMWRFNKFAFLISRYLRLMPQVLIVILLFIAFPLMGDGPYWRGIVQKESENCKRNWWVSALFLQSFYRSDQICNLVTWWLSIEMFYHFTSIIVILALLHSAKRGYLAALTIGGGLTAMSCYLHYVNSYPPNMLPTLLQRYEIWDSIVLKYFWTPYPHAPSYFVGLILGYVLYNRSIVRLTKQQIRFGWYAFAVCYLTILFGTYHWNNNAPYSRIASTAYYNISQVFWPLATAWAILACALGSGGWLNEFLSSPIFVPLGRATYMTYLSHMLIVMAYPAKQNLLIEPSYIVFLYIFISNLCLSYMLGIVLTLVYESPILHLQKLIVTNMAQKMSPSDEQRSRKSTVSNGRTVHQTGTNQDASVRASLFHQEQHSTELSMKQVVSEDETNQSAPVAN